MALADRLTDDPTRPRQGCPVGVWVRELPDHERAAFDELAARVLKQRGVNPKANTGHTNPWLRKLIHDEYDIVFSDDIFSRHMRDGCPCSRATWD